MMDPFQPLDNIDQRLQNVGSKLLPAIVSGFVYFSAWVPNGPCEVFAKSMTYRDRAGSRVKITAMPLSYVVGPRRLRELREVSP